MRGSFLPRTSSTRTLRPRAAAAVLRKAQDSTVGVRSGQTDGLDFDFRAVRGIYAYASGGPDELSLDEGELIELTSGPNGGQQYGDGWWQGKWQAASKGLN